MTDEDPDTASDGAGDIVYDAAPAEGGDWLVWLCAVATVTFCVVGLASIPATPLRSLYVWICGSLFIAGIAGFLVAVVMSGSRALDGVGVRASSLFLAGFAARRDQLIFRLAFAASIAVGLGVALVVGTGPDAGPFVLDVPATAYGILVPIFSPAVAGIHGARYCAWPTRKS